MTNYVSNRVLTIQTLKRFLRELRGGRYECRRGTVNWGKWDFTKHPFGLALSMPEEDESQIATVTTVSLIFMTRSEFPDGFNLDDSTIEDFRADARLVAKQLMEAKRPDSTSNLVTGLTFLPSAELADAEKQLQGVSAAFVMEY